MLTGFGLRSKSKVVRLVEITLFISLKMLFKSSLLFIIIFPEQHLWNLHQKAVLKNLNEKFTHFRYKEHAGDLFRGTVIVPLPDPYKDQKNFWIWLRPCFQTNQDVANLNDLYKYLDDEWFDDDVMETDDYKYYSTMPKDQIRDEIKSLEHRFSLKNKSRIDTY